MAAVAIVEIEIGFTVRNIDPVTVVLLIEDRAVQCSSHGTVGHLFMSDGVRTEEVELLIQQSRGSFDFTLQTGNYPGGLVERKRFFDCENWCGSLSIECVFGDCFGRGKRNAVLTGAFQGDGISVRVQE